MSTEHRKQWMEHKADQAIAEFDVACLSLLPLDLQTAIKGLVAYAFERGYDWGVNDGRVSIGTGHTPTYHVPEPVVEIVIEPPNVA